MTRLLLAFLLTACGGAAEAEKPGLTLERLAMPDPSQAPFELRAGGETFACAAPDCEPALELPPAPQDIEVQDALGNVFHLRIEDVGKGFHRVEEPLAPEAGVFLLYVLEYTVR